MKKILSVLGILFVTVLCVQLSLLCTQLSWADELQQSTNAHGGLDTFRDYGTLEYDQSFQYRDVVSVKDHQLFDLNSRKALLTSEDYKIGFDGQEAWIEPNMKAIAMPPRFYATTPFYFFGLPFFFSDPGVNAESLGTQELDGKEYNVVKFTYDEGIGDTPKDDYIAYFNKDTNQMEILNYIVTYPPLTGGKSIEELERHAAVYEEWQEVDGLIVPKKVSFYEWTDNKPGTESIGFMEYENVSFKKENPSPTVFEKPKGAEVDNSHISN